MGEPWFQEVLPYFQRLEALRVTSDDVALSTLLHLLPSSITHLDYFVDVELLDLNAELSSLLLSQPKWPHVLLVSVDDVELFKEVHGALLEKLWDVGGKIKLQLKDEMPVWLARSCASASPYEQLALTLLLCSQEESLPSHRTNSEYVPNETHVLLIHLRSARTGA